MNIGMNNEEILLRRHSADFKCDSFRRLRLYDRLLHFSFQWLQDEDVHARMVPTWHDKPSLEVYLCHCGGYKYHICLTTYLKTGIGLEYEWAECLSVCWCQDNSYIINHHLSWGLDVTIPYSTYCALTATSWRLWRRNAVDCCRNKIRSWYM